MRFAGYVRPLPRLPKLPAPKLTSQDVARALSEVLQNQAAIMDEIAQIKYAIQWLNAQTFSAMVETPATPDKEALVFQNFLRVNAALPQVLSDTSAA